MEMINSDEGDSGRVLLRVLRYGVDGVQGLFVRGSICILCASNFVT